MKYLFRIYFELLYSPKNHLTHSGAQIHQLEFLKILLILEEWVAGLEEEYFRMLRVSSKEIERRNEVRSGRAPA